MRIILAAALLSACSADRETSDTIDAIFGPSTVNVDAAGTGFEAAVGSLFGCSATAISRSAIVTAKHCLCGNNSAASTFCLPQGGSGDRCASFNFDEGWTTSISGVANHPLPAYETGCGGYDDSFPGPDLMVMFLTNNIPVSVLPELPGVYLGDDVLNWSIAEAAAHGGEPHFFIVGFGGTAWKSTANGGIRRRGEAGTDLHYQNNDTTFESWHLESDANDDPAAIDTIAKGD